jgi:hypothetical protein
MTTRSFFDGFMNEFKEPGFQPAGTTASAPRFLIEGKRQERIMPVLVMWAVPAVIVIGGVGYWLVHMH